MNLIAQIVINQNLMMKILITWIMVWGTKVVLVILILALAFAHFKYKWCRLK